MFQSWLFWTVLTVLSWGICPILEKLGVIRLNPSGLLLIQSFIIFSIMLVGLLSGASEAKVSFADLNVQTVLLVLGVAIIGGLVGEFAYLKAIELADTGKVVALTSIYPIVTLGLSILFLGERLSATNMIGFLCVVCGVIMLSSESMA